ncbi:UNVERIFIED_ORG: hypothetical protein ABIB13_000262 [Arthrobacter sp. UYEF2]
MTDPPPDHRTTQNPNAGTNPGRGPATKTPRWVKVFGLIAVALVLIFIVSHLAGGGMGNHTP